MRPGFLAIADLAMAATSFQPEFGPKYGAL
jgi:hypothetical protein